MPIGPPDRLGRHDMIKAKKLWGIVGNAEGMSKCHHFVVENTYYATYYNHPNPSVLKIYTHNSISKLKFCFYTKFFWIINLFGYFASNIAVYAIKSRVLNLLIK